MLPSTRPAFYAHNMIPKNLFSSCRATSIRSALLAPTPASGPASTAGAWSCASAASSSLVLRRCRRRLRVVVVGGTCWVRSWVLHILREAGAEAEASTKSPPKKKAKVAMLSFFKKKAACSVRGFCNGIRHSRFLRREGGDELDAASGKFVCSAIFSIGHLRISTLLLLSLSLSSTSTSRCSWLWP